MLHCKKFRLKRLKINREPSQISTYIICSTIKNLDYVTLREGLLRDFNEAYGLWASMEKGFEEGNVSRLCRLQKLGPRP